MKRPVNQMFPKSLDQGTLLSGTPVRPESCVPWVTVAHTGV